jgi:hypothetical protein
LLWHCDLAARAASALNLVRILKSSRKSSHRAAPPENGRLRVTIAHDVTFAGGADLPVYIRVTQADGHQAWPSPIYLIA